RHHDAVRCRNRRQSGRPAENQRRGEHKILFQEIVAEEHVFDRIHLVFRARALERREEIVFGIVDQRLSAVALVIIRRARDLLKQLFRVLVIARDFQGDRARVARHFGLGRIAEFFLELVRLGADSLVVAQRQRVQQPGDLAVLRYLRAGGRAGDLERLFRLLLLGFRALAHPVHARFGGLRERAERGGDLIIEFRLLEVLFAERLLGFVYLLLREDGALLFLALRNALAHFRIARIV